MLAFTHRIAAVVTALCAPVLGIQGESEVQQRGTNIEGLQEHVRKQVVGCSSDMLWVARQFKTNLARNRADLLIEMFTDTGVAIIDNQTGSLSDVLNGFTSSLQTSTVAEEGTFCITSKGTPQQIAIRLSTFDQGTFMAQFLLEEAEGTLLIALAEIFSNSFAQPATDMQSTKNSLGVQQEVCPQEAIQLVTGYVAALGARDHRTLAKMFSSSGQVLSTSTGLRDPEDFFRDFLTSLKDARAVDQEIFCEMESGSPMVLVRFDFFYKPKGSHDHDGHGAKGKMDDQEWHEGVYIDQFAFIRKSKHSPLKLKFVHMFENPAIQPATVSKDAGYQYSQHGSSCSYEALLVVRKYLRALGDCNHTAVLKIFAPEAVVVTADGKANAREFYATHLLERSLGKVVEQAVFCDDPPEKTWPSMSVRFHYSYVQTITYSSNVFGHFHFGRRDKDAPLQILKLELFENSLIQAIQPSWYISYLPFPDHNLQREYHEKTKFLVRHLEVEGCSPEARALVDAYFHALEHNVSSLQTILAPGAKLLSPHAGSRLAMEFYASIMPMFEHVSVVKEEQFCQMHEKFGTIATRSTLSLDNRIGVIFSHFSFMRKSKHAPLQLSKIEIFDNEFILPAIHGGHHAQQNHVDQDPCSHEAYDLVKKYLLALATKNLKSMGALFGEGGKVVSPSIGVKKAKDFYQQFLPMVSDVEVGHATIECVTHVDEPPTVTATYMLAYSLAGMRAESKYVTTFHFVRENSYLKLKLEMVEMLQVPVHHAIH